MLSKLLLANIIAITDLNARAATLSYRQNYIYIYSIYRQNSKYFIVVAA